MDIALGEANRPETLVLERMLRMFIFMPQQTYNLVLLQLLLSD